MKYLTERHQSPTRPSGPRTLVESTKVRFDLVESTEAGPLRVRGEVGRADRPTGNGREYPMDLLKREIGSLQPAITERMVLGELDHPGDGRSSLQRASHVVTALELMEDGRVIAEYEVLPTDCGRNLEAILRAGCKIGASIRGFGSTKVVEGREVVQNDYRLVTFDAVLDPADVDAYPEVVKESLDRPNTTHDVDVSRKLDEAIREGMAVGAAQARQALTEEYEDRMVRAIEEARTEARLEIETELAGAPGALRALRAIQEAILPYMLPSAYRSQVDKALAKATDAEEMVAKLQRENRALECQLRESIYTQIVATLPEALREKALAELGDLVEMDAETFEARFTRVKADLLAAHVESLTKTQAALTEQTHAARRVALDNYIEEKLRMHPHAGALRKQLQLARPTTTGEVDRLIEDYRPDGRGSLMETVRHLASRGPRGVVHPRSGEETTNQDE